MDSSSSSSYDSYSSNASSVQLNPRYHEQERTTGKSLMGFRSSLHSVRKRPSSKNIMKKPIAPLPPTPPKIYKVDPLAFKDVVQKLTSAQEFQPTRLQEVAPPPLSLAPPRAHRLGVAPFTEETQRRSFDSAFGDLSPLGFSLSPASLDWCSSFLFSPTTISAVESNSVLY
ncbi:uncharacterized protein [Henckelia pumila]|uniref:uncharacterized protein n=1 Tax=Henckelia pumila TaxID=405737 RepID=UPI003C6E1140